MKEIQESEKTGITAGWLFICERKQFAITYKLEWDKWLFVRFRIWCKYANGEMVYVGYKIRWFVRKSTEEYIYDQFVKIYERKI